MKNIRNVKKYIAMGMVCMLMMMTMAGSGAFAEEPGTTTVIDSVTTTDTAASDAAGTTDTATTDSTTTESAETNTDISTITENSTSTDNEINTDNILTEDEITIDNKVEEEQAIKEANERIITSFIDFDINGTSPYAELQTDDINTVLLPDTIEIVNGNNSVATMEASWLYASDNLTSHLSQYSYNIILPEGYSLAENLKTKLDKGEIVLPFITVMVNNSIEENAAIDSTDVGNSTTNTMTNFATSSLPGMKIVEVAPQTAAAKKITISVLDRV